MYTACTCTCKDNVYCCYKQLYVLLVNVLSVHVHVGGISREAYRKVERERDDLRKVLEDQVQHTHTVKCCDCMSVGGNV